MNLAGAVRAMDHLGAVNEGQLGGRQNALSVERGWTKSKPTNDLIAVSRAR
jgi:hypothetical protein